jgi:hypothetical protein
MSSIIEWGEIQGRPITFPLQVLSFNAVSMTFDVPSNAARALLPGDAFELVEVDGVAQFVLNVCDYRENPWGDYNEVNLGFLARPTGAPVDVIGSFIYRMPVDQDFTCEAGNKVMGFPKTVERIDFEYGNDKVSIKLLFDGQLAFSITIPRPTASGDAVRMDRSATRTSTTSPTAPLELDVASGTIDPSDVLLELGSGIVADELRSLGLPKPPTYCSWGEALSATFQLGSRVR